MVKTFLAAFAIVAFVVVSAHATGITIDSTISQWSAAGLLRTDIQNTGAPMTLQAWGISQQNGRIYAIMQNGSSLVGGTYDNFWASFWVDADNSGGTGSQMIGIPSPDGWAGSDIYAEYDTDNPVNQVAYWGKNHDNTNGLFDIAPSAQSKISTTTNASDTIAISVSLTDLQTYLYNYNHGYSNSCDTLGATYNVGVRLAGHVSGVDDWSGDIGGSMVTIPEPGTLAMLIGAGLALLGLARLRRRS